MGKEIKDIEMGCSAGKKIKGNPGGGIKSDSIVYTPEAFKAGFYLDLGVGFTSGTGWK